MNTDRIAPLTTGDERIVPLTAGSYLDPSPWVTPSRQYRLSKRQVEFYAPDCVIFDPREGYEQDKSKYL